MAAIAVSARPVAACAPIALPVPLVAQRGPTCAVAAVVMAMRGLGASIELGALAAEVPVWPDGVGFFDLEEALAARAWASLTFRGDAALAGALLAAGLPVVVALERHGGRHALALAGVDRAGDRCEPTRFSALDPWGAARVSVGADELARRPMFVAWPRAAGWEARVAAAGIDLAALARQDARFRAEELVARAAEHATPNEAMLRLLEKAAAADPSWPEPRALIERTRRALNRERARASP